MKKFGFVFILIFMLVLPFFVNSNKVVFADADNPVELTSFSNFEEDGNYYLSRDLNYDGTPFVPIQRFTGTLNGNGHKIQNITIEASEGDVAIFLNTVGAKIYDLKLEHITIKLTNRNDTYISKVAFLVANAVGTTIENVSIVGNEQVIVNPNEDQDNDLLQQNNSPIILNNGDEEDESEQQDPEIPEDPEDPEIPEDPVQPEEPEIQTDGVSSYIIVSSVSSVYVGGLVCVAQSGTKVSNCNTTYKSVIEIKDNSKQLYYGGTICTIQNSKAYNIIQTIDVEFMNVPVQNKLGGMFAYVLGNATEIKNCILDGSVTGEVAFSAFISEISCPNDIPNNGSISYFYTTLSGQHIGNEEDLIYYHENNYIDFNYANIIHSQEPKSRLCTKEFYTNSNNFDSNREFNFNQYWRITEKASLPYLQRFSTFEYLLSENDSFDELTKPNISSNIIEFLNFDQSYIYGGNIIVAGYITELYNIDLFYKIVGLYCNKTQIFLNEEILNIVENENVEIVEEDDVTIYTLNDDIVIKTEQQIAGNLVSIYTLNDKNISWGIFQNVNGNYVNIYILDNCTMQHEGTYSFKLEKIEYQIEIKTENVLYGEIRRSDAAASYTTDYICDDISYGETLRYFAQPKSDYAFNGWKVDLEDEDYIHNGQTLSIVFNETAFDENGILSRFTFNEEKFTFVATFTKQVCEVKIKFAINEEIKDLNMAKIFINDMEVSPDSEGEIWQKLKKGSTCRISISVPSDKQFTNWYLSDGTKNIGVQSEDTNFVLTIDDEQESMILVANFFEEQKDTSNMGSLWLIIGGAVAGVVVIGLVIFFIVRKRKDNSYKNMYY